MTHWRQLSTTVVTAMLLLSAFASVPVAAQEERIAVSTESPINVTTSTATLEGDLTTIENASNATVWFEYWVEGDAENSTETSSLNVSSTGPFSIDVDGLQANTTYVVVAHARTESATAIGSEISFTTPAEETVSVSTESATDVTTSSATLNGKLTELHGADTASVWFEYWIEGDRANNSTTTMLELDGVGSFSASVDGLANDTDYIYVAHAATKNASAVGDEVDFSTDDEDELDVKTQEPTDVTNRSATFNGELDDLGNASSATVWFEYWEQGDEENATATTNQTLDDPGSFSASVDGLESNSTYFFIARAATENDSDAGGAVTFTTEPDERPLGVDTADPSDVTNTSATLNGELTGLAGEENATVWFEYWVEGDRANNSTTTELTLDEPGGFSASVTDLENETTYRYVANARANGTTVSGDAVSFTTGEAVDDRPTWDGEEPFGRWLSGVIKNLVPPDSGTPLGQIVSDIVRENNPGNNPGPPEHAGPPGDDDESERGPPEHAGPPDDDEDSERGPPDHAGPPEHAGPPDDDGDEDDEEEEDEDDEEN